MQNSHETPSNRDGEKPEQNTEITGRKASYLLSTIRQHPAYADIKTRMLSSYERNTNQPCSEITEISGIQGSLATLLAVQLFTDLGIPVLVLASQSIFDLYDNDLSELLQPEQVHTVSDELSAALGKLSSDQKIVLLASFDDLLTPLHCPEEQNSMLFTLQIDKEAGYGKLKNFLLQNDYSKSEFVEEEGEYSTRGSIIDIFPFGSKAPVRIEFFGDTVTSLRSFDTGSQLSGARLDRALLGGNFVADKKSDSEKSWNLLDHLPAQTLLIIDDITSLSAHENRAAYEDKLMRFRCLGINRIEKQSIDFHAEAQTKLHANFKLFARELTRIQSGKQHTVFVGNSKKEIEELTEFIAEEIDTIGLKTHIEVNWVPLNLHSGFVFSGFNVYTESDIFGKLHTHKSHKKRAFKGISLKDLQKLNIGDYIVHEDYGIGIFKALETIEVGDSEQESVLIEYQGGDQLYVNVQNIRLLSKYTASEGSLPSLSKLGSSKWKAKKEKVKNRLKDIASKLIRLYAKRKMTTGFAFGTDSIFQKEFEASFIFDETPDQLKTIEQVKNDMQSGSPMDRLICGDAGFGKTEIAMRASFKAVESSKQVALLTPTTILAHQHAETFRRRFENVPLNIAVLSRFVTKKEQKNLIEKISRGLIDIVIGTHRLVSKDVVFQDLGLLIIDEEQHFGVSTKEKLRQSFPGVDTLTMSATPIPRTLQFSMLGARDLSIVSTPPKNRQPVETVITQFNPDTIRSAIQHEISRRGQVFFLHNRIAGLDQIRNTLQELVPEARIGIAHGQMPTSELENVMMEFISHKLDLLISTSIIGSGLDISNANTIIINRADMFGLSDLYQLRGRVGRSERKAYSYLIIPPVHTLKREAMERLAVIESFTELGSGFNIALRDLDIRGAGNLLGAEQSGAIHELGFDLYQKLLEEAVSELKTGAFSSLFTDKEPQTIQTAGITDMIFYFDALIPDYYVSATQERFSFYEKISKSTTDRQIEAIEEELRDRFGPVPRDVANLIGLAKLKNLCSSIGLVKVDIQPDKCTLQLPDDENTDFYTRPFFQELIASVQSEWMQKYRPRFQEGKKMKLIIHLPSKTSTEPSVIMERYSSLLIKLKGE
ncbi:MAG: transcription-repair coupling factor [Ignavibacteriaceae bacterium]|nr:transcription-repair coupling factor [Ignavibacteriaceae bacterium]